MAVGHHFMSDISQSERPESEPSSCSAPKPLASELLLSSAHVAHDPQSLSCESTASAGPTHAPLNAFLLFGLPTAFDVCLNTLDQRYEEAQALIHPDQWISETAKQLAAQHSVRCNQAYALLKHPETRAAHILQLGGHWPVPDFPDLFEILLDWHEHGHHPQAQNLTSACQTFSHTMSLGNIEAAQRAYWWIKVISNHKKHSQ